MNCESGVIGPVLRFCGLHLISESSVVSIYRPTSGTTENTEQTERHGGLIPTSSLVEERQLAITFFRR